MNKQLSMPPVFKALIYLCFSLVVSLNYSNFKGHPADWSPFTFLFGLIQYALLISVTGAALFLIIRKHSSIIDGIMRIFSTNKSTSQILVFLFIYLPYLLLSNYIFAYNNEPDLTTYKGKLKWEEEWTTKNDDQVKKRNKGLAQHLPSDNEIKDSKHKISNAIIKQLNSAIVSSSSTNYELISSIFDRRIDSLTPTYILESYKASLEVKIIHCSSNFDDFWGLISFKNNSKNWRDSTRKDLYEDTWFININNNSISTKVLFFPIQYSSKSYCIKRNNSNHYSLNNIYLMKTPKYNEFDKEISPLSPLFWKSKPFQTTQWNNITKRNIELDCVTYDSCFVRPYLSFKK